MKLTELDPRWFDVPGIGTSKDGVTFLCPHCRDCRLAVQFANPIDGEPRPIATIKQLFEGLSLNHSTEERKGIVPPGYLWQRTGETFDRLTLHPSVDASASGHWHGFVVDGEIR